MRLAVVFRRPVQEIARWPAREVSLIEAFLAREPAAEARVEVAVARLAELMVMLWAAKGPRQSLKDFLPYLSVWDSTVELAKSDRYSPLDREVFSVLGTKQ